MQSRPCLYCGTGTRDVKGICKACQDESNWEDKGRQDEFDRYTTLEDPNEDEPEDAYHGFSSRDDI